MADDVIGRVELVLGGKKPWRTMVSQTIGAFRRAHT